MRVTEANGLCLLKSKCVATQATGPAAPDAAPLPLGK